MKKAIITLSEEVTQDILRNRKSLNNQCNYGAAELCRRAEVIGISLKVQGGLWQGRIEHNWCVDPNGLIYDPTAEQFNGGVNGLQTSATTPFYIAVSPTQVKTYSRLAEKQGWNKGHTEGISQIAVGYGIYGERIQILEEFKKFYPDLCHQVIDERKDELKVAKNGLFYAVMRLGGVQFYLNVEDVIRGRNNTLMTNPQIRSFVVFRNESSYLVQEIQQRLYVTPSGKTGLITSRGPKTRIKLSKAGNLYRSYGKNQPFNERLDVDDLFSNLIAQLEEMIKEMKS